jgi:hypothetical protein
LASISTIPLRQASTRSRFPWTGFHDGGDYCTQETVLRCWYGQRDSGTAEVWKLDTELLPDPVRPDEGRENPKQRDAWRGSTCTSRTSSHTIRASTPQFNLHSGGSRPAYSSIRGRIAEFQSLIREQDGIPERSCAIEEKSCAKDKDFLCSRRLAEQLHRICGEYLENDTILETMADPKREPAWQIAN